MTKRNLGIGLLNGSFDFGKVLAVRHEQLLVLFGDFVQDRDVVDALEGFQTMLRGLRAVHSAKHIFGATPAAVARVDAFVNIHV